jgi:membrane-bound lytic murein transglycosylase A
LGFPDLNPFLRAAGLSLALLTVTACASGAPPRLDLQPAAFGDLPGWDADRHGEALAAFKKSCARPSKSMKRPCQLAGTVPAGDDLAARRFFESAFQPFAVSAPDGAEGLFTGYYEPILRGSRKATPRYHAPIYRRPPDLIGVDLGDFQSDLAGKRIMGRVVGDRLAPYADRGEFEALLQSGRLDRSKLEILWLEDEVEAFFLQIQGSGLIELEGGGKVRVGFSAHNGLPYTAIGKLLADRGELPGDALTMQSIKAWLRAHPAERADVLRANRRYVFFRELSGAAASGSSIGAPLGAPIGAMGVDLTAGRSLAVDPAFIPLGAPLWLAASLPAIAQAPAEDLRQLMIAQDTGGAIKGPIRGDIFFGSGDRAGERAGQMKQPGRYWLLLPREVRGSLPEAADVVKLNDAPLADGAEK